jgi:hypothetical protein
MMKSTFWTQRRFTGITLIIGCLLFLAGASMPLVDKKGNFIYGLPPREWLLVIFAHPTLWQWATILLLSGVVVMLLGLTLLTSLLRDAGDRTFSPLGLIAFVFGAVLWVIILAFRLSIDPWAAQETARTAVLPDFYVPLTLWTHALFVIYTILAFSALAIYGGAVLTTRVLPQWVGWLAIVYGLAGLGWFAFTGDAPPGLHHLMPLLMGILLLLRRSQLPTRSHREEASTVAPTPSARI